MPGRLDAVQDRHPDVHEHHIRRQVVDQAHGLGPIGCFPDHDDAVLGGEDSGNAGPE